MEQDKFEILTESVQETQIFAKNIGAAIKQGTVLALTGDLGSGKTAFVQGLARGLEVPEDYYITSPSYTLLNEYPGRIALFHADLYRLNDATDFENIGLYEIINGPGIVAVEWADRLDRSLLSDYLNINIQIIKERVRKISLTPYGRKAINLLGKIEKIYKV